VSRGEAGGAQIIDRWAGKIDRQRFPHLVSGPARSYDVTAEGQRFVVTTYEPAVATLVTELQMIVNWGAGAR